MKSTLNVTNIWFNKNVKKSLLAQVKGDGLFVYMSKEKIGKITKLIFNDNKKTNTIFIDAQIEGDSKNIVFHVLKLGGVYCVVVKDKSRPDMVIDKWPLNFHDGKYLFRPSANSIKRLWETMRASKNANL